MEGRAGGRAGRTPGTPPFIVPHSDKCNLGDVIMCKMLCLLRGKQAVFVAWQ